jgi:hypothetical protein
VQSIQALEFDYSEAEAVRRQSAFLYYTSALQHRLSASFA